MGGVSRHEPGQGCVYPSMYMGGDVDRGCVDRKCTLPFPPVTATAVAVRYPTEIRTCFYWVRGKRSRTKQN